MSKILEEVIEEFREREKRGVMKYGVTMDRADLLSDEWIQHFKEELMDAILYLKKIQSNERSRSTYYEKENYITNARTNSDPEVTNTRTSLRNISKAKQRRGA